MPGVQNVRDRLQLADVRAWGALRSGYCVGFAGSADGPEGWQGSRSPKLGWRYGVRRLPDGALEGLLQYDGTVRWQVSALGFFLGGVCGMLAARSWIRRHPEGEEPTQPTTWTRWFRSWWILGLILLVTLITATVPPLAPAMEWLSSHTDLGAAMQQSVAGLALVFGLFLTAPPRGPR